MIQTISPPFSRDFSPDSTEPRWAWWDVRWDQSVTGHRERGSRSVQSNVDIKNNVIYIIKIKTDKEPLNKRTKFEMIVMATE